MTYAIIGSGKIGTALARVFARHGIDVAVANTRGPQALAPLVEELGPTIRPLSSADAVHADIIFLAVPYARHRDVAGILDDWSGKIIIDATNAFGIPPEELAGRLSSEIVADAFKGARIAKAFNHLPAEQLGSTPPANGKQVIFISSNDPDTSAAVADLSSQLGFAPVKLGMLAEAGTALHVRNGKWGVLFFQNLVKLD